MAGRLGHSHAHKLLIYTHAHNPDSLRFTRDGETLVLPAQDAAAPAGQGEVLRGLLGGAA